MTHMSYRKALAVNFAHVWGEPAPTQDEIEARAWLAEMAALLRRVPAAVCLAQPVHADNVEVMNNALGDLTGDVIGHFRKGEGNE